MSRIIHIDFAGKYQPGDPPPSGYLDWHEWAAVQDAAALAQVQCGNCGRWKFPQELSGETRQCKVVGRARLVEVPICLKCRD